jgi:acyl-CoA thioesterase FadM
MRLRLRLLFVLIASLWHSKMRFLDESVLSFRVLPNDIDIRQMTNDRFIALMDLGRMDVAFRVGLLKPMIKQKWVPLATFNTIRFRHFLKIFQKYRLHTRIIYWDDNTFYFEQQFERCNRILATGYVCATCLGSKGPIDSEEVIASTGQVVNKPPKSVIVFNLQTLEKMIHECQSNLN